MPKTKKASVVLFVAIVTVSVCFGSEPQKERQDIFQYELYKDFVPTVGWRRCHRLSFPCLTGQYEISQHFLFGKTNEHAIKFRSGLCHPATLLCVEAAYSWENKTLSLVLAETEDNEEWPDDIVDSLQPKKALEEFTVPIEGWITHTEWDETSFWGYDEDTRKADFLLWISTHAW